MDNLTIVIPYRNERDALKRLLPTLPGGIPVLVVDDVSEVPPETNGARVLRRKSRGYFSGAVNAGIRACETDVLVLNQDIWFNGHQWLDEVAELRERYAMFGDGVMNHPSWPKGYVQGTFMYMRRDAIERVGLLDERDWPLWGATAEWQLRACRAGFAAKPMHVDWFEHERHGYFGKSISAAVQDEPGRKPWLIRTPPMVSVVIPCYNYGRFLPDAIASLIGGDSSLGEQPGQTFHGFDIIMVDDASTDDSVDVMKALSDPWKGIRYVQRKVNGGTPAANNTGIRHAKGRFIQFLAADDMLAPTAIETSYRIVEQDPTLVPYADQHLFRDGAVYKTWQMKEYDFEELLRKNHVPAGKMFSKRAWAEIGGYPERFVDGREDWAFAVALGNAGYCGVRVPAPLYWYRRADYNRTTRNTTPVWRRRFHAQMVDEFPDLYKGARPMGCCGGRAQRVIQSNPKTKGVEIVSIPVGQKGMTLVEYIGGNESIQTWYGPVTRARYRFGAGARDRQGYVDTRDLEAFTNAREGRRAAFRVIKQDTKQVEVELEQDESVPAVQAADQEEVEPDVAEMSVREIREAVKTATLAQTMRWLKAERVGKARKTALAALEEAVHEE